MATASAALVSLLNTLDQIHNQPLVSTFFDQYYIESLRKKVDFFLDFVENYSAGGECQEAEDLVRGIAVAANAAEQVLEVQAAHQICAAASAQQSSTSLPNLQSIIGDMDSIEENVIKVKEEEGFKDCTAPVSSSSSSALATPNSNTTMVGFEAHLEQLLDELTGQHSGRRILPIVGMGGIGKTTLAINVYENLLTVEHFYVRGWVTVSQEFSVREILLQALSCLGVSTREMDTNDDELGQELYKILSGRRYLVVLDDVWSVEAWEKIKFFFPENNNRSRIIVTTRQSELVDYFGSSALAVDFLDEKNSWHLFCEKAFAKQGCQPELVEIGKKIVYKCQGLPLAIVVIGGFLGKSPRILEYWETVAKDKSLILDSGEGKNSLSILNLSYKHLPVWLKSCFLYLGLFPEDHRINVSQLIKLWVAEGFIKPKADQSLEEAAESYIKDLVDRNLLLVGDFRLNKKFKTCYVHDLVRDLCIRIGEKENSFWFQSDIDGGRRQFIVDDRTTTFYPRYYDSSKPSSIFRPRIIHGQRVLFFDGLGYDFRQVNLRFLYQHVGDGNKLPSSMSLLWNLQTLIVHSYTTIVAPPEIWKMSQLRHIEMVSIYLPLPSSTDDGLVLQNLQTLEKVQNLSFTKELCKRIPNIKDLRIRYNFLEHGGGRLFYNLHNLGQLNKLESLHYSCQVREQADGSLQKLKLPSSLKELILKNCNLVWSDIAMIASLPRLQILILIGKAVVGEEWNFVEEEFLCLKYLRISGCDDLIKWNIAGTSNFPVLETLCLDYLSNLDEVPPSIGDLLTLEKIELCYCSESATISAVKILEEQESIGNEGDGAQGSSSRLIQDPVHVPVGPVTRARAKKFKENLMGLVQEVWRQELMKRPIEVESPSLINMIKFEEWAHV